MFDFFKKKPIAEDDPFRKSLPDTEETFVAFADSDVAIKLWLPEELDQRIKHLSDYFGISRPRYLRVTFFIHLYGRYRLEQMRQRANSGLFYEAKRTILESRGGGEDAAPEPIEKVPPHDLGKNFKDVKLWLPLKLRDDLQVVSARVGQPLSAYMRQVLLEQVYGHAAALAWQKTIAAEQEQLRDKS